ncbi:MAG: hypothetical protein AAF692_04560 [Pseudomonadota bacterium]
MDSFLFCLILVALIAVGGREQWLVAQLSDALAQREGTIMRRPVPVLALGVASAAATAGVMTLAATTLAGLMPDRAAWMLVAFALAIAALELFWPIRPGPLGGAQSEPTRSAGAIGLVLVWRQLGDAARFVIFAFAVEATFPITALIGGAMGGAAAVAMGWGLGAAKLSQWPLRAIRIALGLCLIVAALFIGLNARYAIW